MYSLRSWRFLPVENVSNKGEAFSRGQIPERSEGIGNLLE